LTQPAPRSCGTAAHTPQPLLPGDLDIGRINNTRGFGIGKLLKNLPELRRVGFQATGVSWTSKLYPTIVRFPAVEPARLAFPD
jgi:hypothetical protein